MPGTDEFRAGRVEDFENVDGTRMPIVTDYRGSEYPVHPGSITDVIPT